MITFPLPPYLYLQKDGFTPGGGPHEHVHEGLFPGQDILPRPLLLPKKHAHHGDGVPEDQVTHVVVHCQQSTSRIINILCLTDITNQLVLGAALIAYLSRVIFTLCYFRPFTLLHYFPPSKFHPDRLCFYSISLKQKDLPCSLKLAH